MATQNKFNSYTTDLTAGKHDWSTHVFKIALSNTAPVATNTILANIAQITAANGYTSGGNATTVTKANAAGVETISGTQVVFTAVTAAMAAFRYAVLYNDTQTTPVKPLVSWIDYGSSLTLQVGDSLTIQFNSVSPGAINTTT